MYCKTQLFTEVVFKIRGSTSAVSLEALGAVFLNFAALDTGFKIHGFSKGGAGSKVNGVAANHGKFGALQELQTVRADLHPASGPVFQTHSQMHH